MSEAQQLINQRQSLSLIRDTLAFIEINRRNFTMIVIALICRCIVQFQDVTSQASKLEKYFVNDSIFQLIALASMEILESANWVQSNILFNGLPQLACIVTPF